jgi:hypothetical protein
LILIRIWNPSKTLHPGNMIKPFSVKTHYWLIGLLLCWVTTLLANDAVQEDNRAQAHLNLTLRQGEILWHSPQLGRIGKSCQQCHAQGVNGQAYPRYIVSEHRVVPLRYMINRCLQKYQLGSPLPEDSPSLIALEAFLIHSPSKGLTTP